MKIHLPFNISTPMKKIPFARPLIGDDEINEVIDTLRSGWLTTGPKVKQFEEDFAAYIGVKHALAVSSATAGLHLGLEALGVGVGDKVITTVHTFTATAEVIRYLGADPIFVDMEEGTFNLDLDAVEHILKTTNGIKAIIPVHFAGQSVDMTRLNSLAAHYDIRVMEDAAHALPTTHHGVKIGSLSEISVFSFYANKTITTGEGGMITTNDDALAKRMKIMRLHGISRDAFDRFTSDKPSWHYQVVAPGFKYNMMDLAAVVGIHQLKKSDEFQQRRQQIAEYYNEALKYLPIDTPLVSAPDDMHSWHIYVIQLKLEEMSINRNTFIEQMAEQGVGTSVHYIPLHQQPYWQQTYALEDEQFPRSSAAYERIVTLPNYPSMTDAEVERVVEVIKLIFEKQNA